jgi:hypothetical protein
MTVFANRDFLSTLLETPVMNRVYQMGRMDLRCDRSRAVAIRPVHERQSIVSDFRLPPVVEWPCWSASVTSRGTCRPRPLTFRSAQQQFQRRAVLLCSDESSP